jgi:hypothetical protein
MTTSSTDKPNWFAVSWLGQFLSSPAGRITRVAAGVAIIAVGLLAVGGTVGIILAAVGLVPLLAGVFDVCIFSALFGGPFRGAGVRACAR